MSYWNRYLYYFLIGVFSVIALVFLPLLGSTVGMGFNFPTTAAGWVVYVISQLITATLNILIFHSFIQQSKINVRDDANYKRAVELLRLHKNKKYIPRSVAQMNKKEYGLKGISIFLGSLLSAFAISQAILTYDYAKLLTYLLVVGMGIVFGILECKRYEEYYTTEFLDYALYQEALWKEQLKNTQTTESQVVEESTATKQIDG